MPKRREYRYRPTLKPLSKRDLADLETRNALVLEHLEWARGIAASVAKKLPTWFTVDDLIGPAEIGLIRAAEKYDRLPLFSQFHVFALRYVRGACLDAVRRREYKERGHKSLDEPLTASGETRGDIMRDPNPSPEQQAQTREMEAVWGYVWKLPEIHQRVIRALYIDGSTLVELAQTANVGESRLSQIHREALAMLRTMVHESLRP
jgi:RNA polymerase sigma factor (sigma-70 family)